MSISTSSAVSGLADRLPPQAPSHLAHILADLDEADRVDAPNSALKAMRDAFGFLLGHFTDLVSSACLSYGANPELFSRDEDDLVSVAEAEGRLREGLNLLNDKHAEEPVAKELFRVFFDVEQGTPRSFYLLSQGGTVGGGMGLKRFSDFCKAPSRPPGRSEAFKLVGQYRSHLHAWLEMAGRFWEKCTVIQELTSLKARQRIVYKLDSATLSAGVRCDLQGCQACIPSRVIEVPDYFLGKQVLQGFPANVPEHALHLVDRFSEALSKQDVIESTRLMRDTLEFLLRYFAGVSKTLCDTLELLPDGARKHAKDTESVDNCERLLYLCIEALKSQQDEPAARALVGVFFRRTASLELEPRSHTGVLLLEGVLSSWFKRERGQQASVERSKVDFEKYFPLFRDWLAAMYPYFSQCEHFDDPPTPDGHLPLTVRLGDHLLELISPAYTLRIRQCPVCLPNPSWLTQAREATPKAAPAGAVFAADSPVLPVETGQPAPVVAQAPPPPPPPEEPQAFPGEFRPIASAPDGPKFLLRLTRRLDVYVRRGELPEARSALRDTLDYLIRYWAGVAVATSRASNNLTPEQEKLAQESLSIQQCERLLTGCLNQFPGDASQLAQEALQVFYELDVISDELKPLGTHSRMLKMDSDGNNKMQLLAEFCEQTDITDIRRARADLKTFLPVLRDWLSRSQAFFEQCQHHEEEADSEGRMELVVQFDQTYLELVAPDYAFYVKKGADSVPDLPVPEWVEPEEPEEEKVVEKKVAPLRPDELAMAEPFLVHKVAFVGLRANSKGDMCKSGIIKIENAGGGSLTGRAFSNHPCIEVSPARFRDNTKIDYWLDESSVPRDFTPTLTLRSGGDERTITVSELRPIGSFNTLSRAQALTLLYLPVASSFLLFLGLLLYTIRSVRAILVAHGSTLHQLASDEQLRNECGAAAQLLGWPYLFIPVFACSVCFYLFRRFSPIMQDLTVKHFNHALMAPTAINLFFMAIGVFRGEYANNNELKAMNLPQLLPWFVAFNIGAYMYVKLSWSNKLAEWIPEPAFRKLVGPVLFAIFLTLSTLSLM